MLDAVRWAGNTVDWFYNEVLSTLMGTPGKGLYDVLILPISGEVNRIRSASVAPSSPAWRPPSSRRRKTA